MKFAATTGVRPMTETFPLEKAQEAYDRMISNKARFRVVLTTGNRLSSMFLRPLLVALPGGSALHVRRSAARELAIALPPSESR
jgi:pyruvate/2-oxoglutarate/acetoin dehydrogenase E1 component